MNSLQIETDIENADFYLASLAIGILKSMKKGIVPFEVGIWSLARPIFWQDLANCTEISSELIEIISNFDEIDGLDKEVSLTIIDKMLINIEKIQVKGLKNEQSFRAVANII